VEKRWVFLIIASRLLLLSLTLSLRCFRITWSLSTGDPSSWRPQSSPAMSSCSASLALFFPTPSYQHISLPAHIILPYDHTWDSRLGWVQLGRLRRIHPARRSSARRPLEPTSCRIGLYHLGLSHTRLRLEMGFTVAEPLGGYQACYHPYYRHRRMGESYNTTSSTNN
jgi:hypothetical protein